MVSLHALRDHALTHRPTHDQHTRMIHRQAPSCHPSIRRTVVSSLSLLRVVQGEEAAVLLDFALAAAKPGLAMLRCVLSLASVVQLSCAVCVLLATMVLLKHPLLQLKRCRCQLAAKPSNL